MSERLPDPEEAAQGPEESQEETAPRSARHRAVAVFPRLQTDRHWARGPGPAVAASAPCSPCTCRSQSPRKEVECDERKLPVFPHTC